MDLYAYHWPSAQGMVDGVRARGMPFAWTHRLVTDEPDTDPPYDYMSRNGYTHPDGGAHCYIGFPWGSASLSQQLDPDYPNKYYWMWVEDFFLNALSWDLSVIQALDHASYENFNCFFDDDNNPLYDGFVAIWPPLSMGNCKMVVYGNGDLHLYEYFVHYPYEDKGTDGSGLVSNPNGFTGAQPNEDYTRLRAVGVYDQAGVIGSMGYIAAHGHIYVRGYSASGYTSRLRVYASYYEDDWECVSGNIVVSPGSARWIDCGVWSSTFRYIGLVVYRESAGDRSSDLYLDSVLVRPPLPAPNTCQLTVLAYNQYGSGYVPLFIDDVYVGTTGYTYTVTAGNHEIYVASPLTDYYTYYHEFQYYYYDGTYNYNNPMTLSVTQTKQVTAYYYSYYA